MKRVGVKGSRIPSYREEFPFPTTFDLSFLLALFTYYRGLDHVSRTISREGAASYPLNYTPSLHLLFSGVICSWESARGDFSINDEALAQLSHRTRTHKHKKKSF